MSTFPHLFNELRSFISIICVTHIASHISERNLGPGFLISLVSLDLKKRAWGGRIQSAISAPVQTQISQQPSAMLAELGNKSTEKEQRPEKKLMICKQAGPLMTLTANEILISSTAEAYIVLLY